MKCSIAVFLDDKVAFHLFLLTGKTNSIFSTIPQEILRKHYLKEFVYLQNSLVCCSKSGYRLLDEFSTLLLLDDRVSPYFYPTYLNNGGVTFQTAEKLIQLQLGFQLLPGMCFSKTLNPIEFFYTEQIFLLGKRHILRTSKKMTQEEFTAKYIVSIESKFCFRSLKNVNDDYLELANEDAECALLLDKCGAPKMFVSI